MLIESFPSLRLYREVPGLHAGQHAQFPLGLSGRLQPCLAASTASPAHSVALAGCAGAKENVLYTISLFSSLHISFLPFLFCLLLFPFVVPTILFPLQASFFSYPACYQSPQPPSLLFSLLSTSDPHPVTPAGSSSPGTHQGCETDAVDQQRATAQPQPPAGSQLSCPSFPSGELKP